jgi:hypothetical protein
MEKGAGARRSSTTVVSSSRRSGQHHVQAHVKPRLSASVLIRIYGCWGLILVRLVGAISGTIIEQISIQVG